jgi:hypothetical protein
MICSMLFACRILYGFGFEVFVGSFLCAIMGAFFFLLFGKFDRVLFCLLLFCFIVFSLSFLGFNRGL